MSTLLNLHLSIASLLRRIFSRRFLKFGTVGASGTLVNLGIQQLGMEYIFHSLQQPGLKFNLSLALGIFLATVNNFFWNRLWTWADREQHYHKPWLAQFWQYTLSCWLSIVLQFVLANLLAPHFNYRIANLIAIGLTSVLNFLLNDIWTFGRLKFVRHGEQPHKD
jgi:putative flippase GtrA